MWNFLSMKILVMKKESFKPALKHMFYAKY